MAFPPGAFRIARIVFLVRLTHHHDRGDEW